MMIKTLREKEFNFYVVDVSIIIRVLLGVSEFMVIFFSIRRLHTRYWRDWSSDVCSSDLVVGHVAVQRDRLAGEEALVVPIVEPARHVEDGLEERHRLRPLAASVADLRAIPVVPEVPAARLLQHGRRPIDLAELDPLQRRQRGPEDARSRRRAHAAGRQLALDPAEELGVIADD